NRIDATAEDRKKGRPQATDRLAIALIHPADVREPGARNQENEQDPKPVRVDIPAQEMERFLQSAEDKLRCLFLWGVRIHRSYLSHSVLSTSQAALARGKAACVGDAASLPFKWKLK